MAGTVNHGSQRGEYRPRARTLHPFVTNRVPRFTFFPFLFLFLLFSFVFFSFFFFTRKSLLGQREIHPFHKREEEEEEGEGGGGGRFSIAFPFRSTIWRGKVRKNGCDGGDGTSSVEIPRSPPRPRLATWYVQEEDIARKVERERERIVRAVAVYTGYKIRCLERLSAWSRLSAFRVRFSSFRSSPPPPCHLRFRLERNTVPSIPSELYRVVQIVP